MSGVLFAPSKKRYLLLDTWAVDRFTREDTRQALLCFLREEHLCLIINGVLLVELYNPSPAASSDGDDSIGRLAGFFSEVDFVISESPFLLTKEGEAYPKQLKHLPLKFKASTLRRRHSKETIRYLFTKLLRGEYADVGFDVPIHDWAKNYETTKRQWPDDVRKIIDNALREGTLLKDSAGKVIARESSKGQFVQSLDLRLVDRIVELKEWLETNQTRIEEYLKRNKRPPGTDMKYIGKLLSIIERRDTHIMRGIHLTSLAFWQEYIKQQKPVRGSDVGDFAFLSFVPYCEYAVLDKSRVNMFQQIIRRDGLYENVTVLNAKRMRELLSAYV